MGGGKFANGAVTAAFSEAFNEGLHEAQEHFRFGGAPDFHVGLSLAVGSAGHAIEGEVEFSFSQVSFYSGSGQGSGFEMTLYGGLDAGDVEGFTVKSTYVKGVADAAVIASVAASKAGISPSLDYGFSLEPVTYFHGLTTGYTRTMTYSAMSSYMYSAGFTHAQEIANTAAAQPALCHAGFGCQ